MATNSPEPTPQPAGGLQSMLARLRGMVQALKSSETTENAAEDVLPTFDVPESPASASPPVASPVDDGTPPAEPVGESPPPIAELVESPAPAPLAEAPQLCPYCRAPRNSVDTYCGNCGWVFASEETVLLAPTPANSPMASSDPVPASLSPCMRLPIPRPRPRRRHARAGAGRHPPLPASRGGAWRAGRGKSRPSGCRHSP